MMVSDPIHLYITLVIAGGRYTPLPLQLQRPDVGGCICRISDTDPPAASIRLLSIGQDTSSDRNNCTRYIFMFFKVSQNMIQCDSLSHRTEINLHSLRQE